MKDIMLTLQGLVYLAARPMTLGIAFLYYEFLKLIEAL